MAEATIDFEREGEPHPYHLVEPSPWPLVGSISAGLLMVGMVMWMRDLALVFAQQQGGGIEIMRMQALEATLASAERAGRAGPDFIRLGAWPMLPGALGLALTLLGWWRDVIRESVIEKAHTAISALGMRYGMLLFIASEVMFFVAFFWAFFYFSLFPAGGIWPPEGIETLPAFDIPFMNTLILLLSGTTVTWAHHALQEGQTRDATTALALTVLLGVVFTGFQAYEYVHAAFGIGDTVYGATFFMATGFHGAHVIIGTAFLAVCLWRTMKGHFTPDRHFGFEAAAWYWHFVDAVWLFLFVSIYWWGS